MEPRAQSPCRPALLVAVGRHDRLSRATGVFAGTTTITATSSALLGSVSSAAQLTVKTSGGGY